MKKFYFTLTSILLISINGFAIQLSDNAEVSLLTVSPGTELYSAFGHTAIRINDSQIDFDWTFNYGLFNFNQPNFYLNFTKGDLFYKLGAQQYEYFIEDYQYENRSVFEQVLNLNAEQKQEIFDFLLWNAKPENATYLYDYFFDNCSTRPRDVIMTGVGAIFWDSSYIEKPKSIRQLTDEYLVNQQPWGDFGIDLAMASKINRPATFMEYMFLPEYLQMALEKAKIMQNGQMVNLVQKANTPYIALPEKPITHMGTPAQIFGGLLIIGLLISFVDYKRKTISLWFDGFILATIGLTGLLLLLLWLFTTHHPAEWNLNIAWAFPVHLLVAFLLFNKSIRPKLAYYFLANTFVLMLLLIGWIWFPQEIHYSLLPLMVLLMLRSAYYYRFFKTMKAEKQHT